MAGALAALAGVAVAILGNDDTPPANADSADRLIFWVGCERDVVNLTDAELDAWKARGVDGFVCMVDRLRGMGGSQDFTGDPNASLNGSNYDLQRSLRDSGIVERAAAREMKLYLGFKLANYSNTSTPLMDWFDDAGWSQVVLPKVRDLAGAAKLLGFAGLALDQELYRQVGRVQTATWNWNYPGNSHTEEEVRSEVTRRGAETMGAILDAFPEVELAVYHWSFPGDWNELVEGEVNGIEDYAAPLVHIDFWDGMTSVEGYEAIRFWDNTFYKDTHRGTWENAFTYDSNQVAAVFSRELSNWDYAAERVYLSPFSWINPGPNPESDFDDARPPEYVEEQLLAMRKWGMGGEFANFSYGPLRGFDYSPYEGAMQAASTPSEVDGVKPTLTVAASPTAIEGTAEDDLAIRAVRWSDDRGGSGTAELTWEVISGDYSSGYDWQMRWSIPPDSIATEASELTIVAEDIKGNESAPAVREIRGSS